MRRSRRFRVPNIPYYNQFIAALDPIFGSIYAGQSPQAMLQQLETAANAFIPQYTF